MGSTQIDIVVAYFAFILFNWSICSDISAIESDCFFLRLARVASCWIKLALDMEACKRML